MWILKFLIESMVLEVSFREFHNNIDKGMPDLCEISCSVKGIVILFQISVFVLHIFVFEIHFKYRYLHFN